MADKIVAEVDILTPFMKGLYDSVMGDQPPRRKPYLAMVPEDRIGQTSIPVGPDKVVPTVESRLPDDHDNAPPRRRLPPT